MKGAVVTMAEINAIVSGIWTVLLYFLPGFTFFTVFRYCHGDKAAANDATSIMVDVVFSIVSVWFVRKIFGTIDNHQLLIILLVAVIVIAIALAKFVDTTLYDRVFSSIFHRTTKSDFWEDVFDTDGTVVFIERGTKKVAGFVHLIEVTAGCPWMMLSKYRIFDDKGEVLEEGKANQEIAIKIADGDLISFAYGKDSPYLQKVLSAKPDGKADGKE
jgi:hypothetical protein